MNRWELVKIFLPELEMNAKNLYIKYEKLVIDNDIYQYDSVKKVPVLVAQQGVGRKTKFETIKKMLTSTFHFLINIGVWNISGFPNKLDNVNSDVGTNDFTSFNQTFDVLCCIETWANYAKTDYDQWLSVLWCNT